MTSWKLLAGSVAVAALAVMNPVQAASPSSQPTLVLADASPAAAAPVGGIAPMPDAAVQGAACLGAATLAIGTTYAIGPSELMMLLTGAMHVPSGAGVMFIPMVSILGGGTCAMAAAATPAVTWALDQSDNIGAQFASLGDGLFGSKAVGVEDPAKDTVAAPVRAMTETETQGTGCVVGALAGFAASMATAPMEVTMLSSGATTIVSSTPLLAMGLLGTIVASSCGIGALASLPVVALFNNISTISDSILQAAGGAVTQTASLLGGGRGHVVMVAEGGAAAR